MGFTIEIDDAPVDGRTKQATVSVVGDDQQVVFTDRANLSAKTERVKLSRRIAESLHAQPQEVEQKLETAWTAVVNHVRDQKAKRPQNGTPDLTGPFHTTDLGNARRLVHRHGLDLRYCDPWGKWFTWDGTRWCDDDTRAFERHAKDTVLSIYQEAYQATDPGKREELAKHAMRSEDIKRVRAMIDLARSEPGIPVVPSQLDSNAWLLNCINGTVDLKTGKLRPHSRDDMITKLCAVSYDPDAKPMLWYEFLTKIFAGRSKLIHYIQRLLGYCLTGDVSEQILPIFWGSGANGKSTLLNVILDMLGQDYAIKAASDLLMTKHNDTHPTEKADLFGRRLVACVETDENRRLAETLVKDLTGGDRVRARRMREDFWEFAPTHKPILCTNHRPVIRGTDHAIWRRIRLVPFTVVIPEAEQDKQLPEKLRAELPGILAWCVAGCMEWQREGLGTPEEVKTATAEYRSEQDILGEFIQECCLVHREARTRAGAIYQAYQAWCKRTGEQETSKSMFGRSLEERGFTSDRGTGGVRLWLGIGVQSDASDANEDFAS